MAAPRGYSLIEVLFVTAVIAIVSAIAVPESLVAVDRARAAAATRYLASRMAMARSHAVMRSAHVALRFDASTDSGTSGVTFQMFADGNRNGVRTSDITSGVDPPLDTAASLSDPFPGVAIAVSGEVGGDPIRIGSSNLLSFTPLGTATSGSIYVRAETTRSSPSASSASPDACGCNDMCRTPKPGSTASEDPHRDDRKH